MGHFSEYKEKTVLTVQEGLSEIKKIRRIEKKISRYAGNDQIIMVTQSYTWNVVENKKKRRFEMGGFENDNGLLSVKVYIPVYENEEIVIVENKYVKYEYAISYHEDKDGDFATLEHDSNVVLENFKSLDEFIEYIDEKDWIKNPVQVEESLRYVEETYVRLKSL